MSSDSTRESVIPEEGHIRRLLQTANIMGKIRQSLPTDGNWKRDAESVRSRELGNVKFRAGEMREALRCYGDGVLTAETDRVLALALANRSAALLNLKQYRDCLQDITAALDLDYDARHKLYLRRARCHQALSAAPEALTALSEYRRQLLAMQLPGDTREKLLRLGVTVEQQVAQLPGADSVDDVPPVPTVSYGPHKQLVGASSALQLRQDDDQGRHVVAARDLLAGDTLYVEQPYFCLLLPERRLDHCHHCIRHTHALIPCERCCDVGYCSTICRRDAAATYHGAECGWAGFLDGFGIGRAALRVLSTAGRNRVLALRSRLQEGGASVRPTCSVQLCRCYTDAEDRYLSVFHLVTHLHRCAAEDLYHYSRAALTFAVFLRERTHFFSSCSAQDRQLQLVWTAALLLRHVLQLVCNAHAQTQLMARPDCDVTQLREERVATAVYPSASYMNHSCDPSIINSYYGRCLVVRAIKPVSAGQQVYHCYGAHYARMSTAQRSSALLQQYYFTCRCSYCTEPCLTTFLERLDSLRCACCRDVTLPADDVILRRRCLSCRVVADYTEQCHLVDQISADLEVDDGLTVGELQAMKTRTLRVASPSHRILATIEDALSRRYTQQGMLEEAVRCLESTLDSVAVRYGATSVELGHTLLTYTDVLQLLLSRDPADRHVRCAELKRRLTQAKQIFGVNYGEWSEMYRELQYKLRVICAVGS